MSNSLYLGKLIRAAREEARMSPQTLAASVTEKAGYQITAQNICDIETSELGIWGSQLYAVIPPICERDPNQKNNGQPVRPIALELWTWSMIIFSYAAENLPEGYEIAANDVVTEKLDNAAYVRDAQPAVPGFTERGIPESTSSMWSVHT